MIFNNVVGFNDGEDREGDMVADGIIDVENVQWEMGSNYNDRSVFIPKKDEGEE